MKVFLIIAVLGLLVFVIIFALADLWYKILEGTDDDG